MLLGIVGDFDSKKMRTLVESTFGRWQPSADAGRRVPLPSVTQVKKEEFSWPTCRN